MEGGKGRDGYRNRFSRSPTVVPDSQSPEPARKAPPSPCRATQDRPSFPPSPSQTFRKPLIPARRRIPPAPPPPPPSLNISSDVPPLLSSDAVHVLSVHFTPEPSTQTTRVKQEEEDVKPKLEEEDIDELMLTAYQVARRKMRSEDERARSYAPEPELEIPDVKPKMEEEDTLLACERARRTRERAPSAMPPPKEEDEWMGIRRRRPPPPQPLSRQQLAQVASVSGAQENKPVEVCGDGYAESTASPPPVSTRTNSLFLEADERDRRSLTSVSPEPRIDDDGEDGAEVGVDQLEQTPFEEDSHPDEEDSNLDELDEEDRVDNANTHGVRRKKQPHAPTKKRKRPTEAQDESERTVELTEDAANFLGSLHRPTHRSAITKAKMTNKLAAASHPFLYHAVEAVPFPKPSPRPDHSVVEEHEREQTAEALLAATLAARRTRAAPAQGTDAGPVAEENLPDYDDICEAGEQRQPEEWLEPKREEVVVGKQDYFVRPTKRRAITRWAAVLAPNATDLSEPFSFGCLSADRQLLLDIHDDQDGPRLSPSAVQTIRSTYHHLSQDFRNLQFPGRIDNRAAEKSDLHTLLNRKPSSAAIEQIWTDFLDPAHPAKHRRPDVEPGLGRECLCPLFVPENRLSWEEQMARLEKSGLLEEDLLDVVFEVFGGTQERITRLARDLGAPAKEEGQRLKQIYDTNWIWFDQIVEPAAIARKYKKLCDPVVIKSVVNYLVDRSVEEPKKWAELDRKLEGAMGTPRQTEYHQQRMLKEGAWRVKKRELEELLQRLRRGVDEPIDYAPTTAPSVATAGTSKAACPPPAGRLPDKPSSARNTLSRLPYARPETPDSKTRRTEQWMEKDVGPGRYHWGRWQSK
ncbi:hypothetical protein JCM11251_001157 [Rhodosporidiobolus azoricus]